MSGDLIAFLTRWQFWILELQFALVVATTIVEAPRLRIDRRILVLGMLLGAVAWGMVATLPPRTSRIYYDEHIYQGIGRSFADTHKAEMCNEGVVEYGRLQCQRGIYNKQPHAYPYLLSVAYRLGGVSEAAAFRLNNIATALAVLATVCLAWLLFGDSRVALLAGGLLAMVPMQLWWGNTAAVEPTAALFCAGAALAAVHYARARTGTALAWVVAVTVFAMSFRPESVLIAPVVAFAIVLLAPGEVRTRRFRYGVAAAMAGAVLPLLHLYATRDVEWGTTASRMSVEYLPANMSANLSFYFADERFPPLFAAGAAVALFASGHVRARLLLGVYFLLFWGIFLFFYAGSYNYGADVRYSLMSYVPLTVLAAAGLVRAAVFVRARWLPQVSDRMVVAVLTGVVLFHCAGFLPLVRSTGDEAWAARADVMYAREFARELPANAIVLTHNPSMFHVWGVNAAQLSVAKTDPAYLEHYLFQRFAGGVFVHWNFWCNVDDPVQQSFCREAIARFPHRLIGERHERDYRFALYRLTRPR